MAIAIETDEAKSAAPLAGTGPGLFGIRKRNRSRMVIAVVLALVSLGPLLYMLSLSFQPNGGLLGATVLIPTHPTIQNYVQAWTENSFSHYFVNSLFVAIATVAITVVFASLAAFAFRALQVPTETVDLLYFPRQSRGAELAVTHPPVPPYGPPPPAQLPRRTHSFVRGLESALHDLPVAWLF